MKQVKMLVMGLAIGAVLALGYTSGVFDEAGQAKASHEAFAQA